MFEWWYHTHNGETHGPFSAAQIKQRADEGLLHPDDLLWPEGVDRKEAIPAYAAIAFSATPVQPTSTETPGLPAWLNDVQALEQELARPKASPRAALPEWLDALRQEEGQ